MLQPTREDFARWGETGLAFFGTHLHPNPRLYKYIWQIWTPESPLEGAEFFVQGPRYSTALFQQIEKQINDAGLSGFIYNRRLPRLGPDKPFDLAHPRWANRVWAPAWDDDTDPEWNGHK
ncbi:hypothetical protein [Paraburkholderia sp. 2C]